MNVYVPTAYVMEGWEVVAPAIEAMGAYCLNPATGIKCTVLISAGNHARVVNEKRGVDCWFHVRDLKVTKRVQEKTRTLQ